MILLKSLDLLKIDSLWVKHSQGKFGFSVQKTIYLSVGGEFHDGFEIHIWQDLCDRVGWRVNGDFLDDGQDEEYTFDFSAPIGHLPLLNTYAEGLVIFLFPRLEACIQSQTIKPLELLNSHLGYPPNTSAVEAVEIINSFPNIQSPDDMSKEIALDLLNCLLPGQFQEVIFRYPINEAQLSQNRSQTHIATEVIKFAIQTEGESLSKLLNTIYRVAPHLGRSN